jgi:hypothetical protein
VTVKYPPTSFADSHQAVAMSAALVTSSSPASPVTARRSIVPSESIALKAAAFAKHDELPVSPSQRPAARASDPSIAKALFGQVHDQVCTAALQKFLAYSNQHVPSPLGSPIAVRAKPSETARSSTDQLSSQNTSPKASRIPQFRREITKTFPVETLR